MTTKASHQLLSFLIGGLIAVSLDWGSFFLLNQYSAIYPSFAKAISFLVGTIFAFYFNGVFSFQSSLGKTQFLRHLILYAFSMTINLIVFTFSMGITPTFLGSTSFLSLGFATFVSMTINFVGMRNWVFRRNAFFK